MVYPQQSVNSRAAIGLEGDFASANPRHSMVAISDFGGGVANTGKLISGASSLIDPSTGLTETGLIIGRFGFARNDTGVVTNSNPGVAYRVGFIHRDQVGILITRYAGRAVFYMQPGRELTIFDAGDFLARFAGGAIPGQKVFASLQDGSAIAAAAGSTIAGGSVTATAGAVGTGSIANAAGVNTLTISALTSGVYTVGTVLTSVAGSPTITALGTGTGGTGTYIVSGAPLTVASTTITGTNTLMTVSAVGSGAVAAGEPIAISGGTSTLAPNNATVASLGTGTGGVGTYNLSTPAQFAGSTVVTQAAVETRWYVDLACAPGELSVIATAG